MNLQHYFNPVDFNEYSKDIAYNWKYSLGATIEKCTMRFREGNEKNIELAIVGVPFVTTENESVYSDATNLIRKELYQLAALGKVNIIDFGNLKESSNNKGNYLALRDVVDYLNEMNIVTLILGGSHDFSYGVCQAFRNNKFFSYSTIDAFLDVKKGKETFSEANYLSRIFSSQPTIFEFNLLGHQSHYIPTEYFAKVKGVNNHLRLGQLRDNIGLAEPVFRNTDFLSFDFVALKHSEAPGASNLPNGLRNEEACQLAKYAGLSTRLKVFGLMGMQSEIQKCPISVGIAAQIIWYFIEGYSKRTALKPEGKEGFSVNKVDIAELDAPLNFYQNIETNQWWMEIQAMNKEIIYLACLEKDYLDACSNEIPTIWLKYIQKIDETLK
jgi:arginase family enzyme